MMRFSPNSGQKNSSFRRRKAVAEIRRVSR